MFLSTTTIVDFYKELCLFSSLASPSSLSLSSSSYLQPQKPFYHLPLLDPVLLNILLFRLLLTITFLHIIIMYTSFTLLYALAALVSVHGSPAPVNKRAPSPKILYANDFAAPTSAPVIEKRDNECQIVDVVVSALKVVSQVAYPFCSTYISIPNVTSTVTFVSRHKCLARGRS